MDSSPQSARELNTSQNVIFQKWVNFGHASNHLTLPSLAQTYPTHSPASPTPVLFLRKQRLGGKKKRKISMQVNRAGSSHLVNGLS
ncbi:hypothetical protein XELAEV_18025141mg [Xenopus laevis]|uniref:Uncharacterized protein n=1 Tax=Xenopus laevis TaxID=8355 RepID=A0A974D066_XENLA|nr:hypothetical protein XELAEV_18025141mg [Xenopus laevis]